MTSQHPNSIQIGDRLRIWSDDYLSFTVPRFLLVETFLRKAEGDGPYLRTEHGGDMAVLRDLGGGKDPWLIISARHPPDEFDLVVRWPLSINIGRPVRQGFPENISSIEDLQFIAIGHAEVVV